MSKLCPGNLNWSFLSEADQRQRNSHENCYSALAGAGKGGEESHYFSMDELSRHHPRCAVDVGHIARRERFEPLLEKESGAVSAI
ncbi:hypothetical protein ACEQPO_04520 [Bacillus sp. SL00103]